MRKISLAFALLALAAPAVRADSFAETEKVSRRLAFQPGGTLRLKTFSGRVTITAWDKNEVAVEAVRRADRDRLDRITLDIHTEGSTLVIDANHRDRSWFDSMRDNVVETDLDIAVPRRTDLDLHTFSAPITVEGVEGSSRVHGFSSRIRLNGISGPVQAHTFSGPVEIHARSWRDRQAITVDTFSGDIELHVPDNAGGHVTFSSFSGRLSSEMPLTLHSSSRRNLSAELVAKSLSLDGFMYSSSRRNLSAELGGGSDGSSLRFKTFSGSVRIDR